MHRILRIGEMSGRASVASHWTKVAIPSPATGLQFTATWKCQNTGDTAADVYMELEVVRPSFPSPQRLVQTLPGQDKFFTEMSTRALVVTTAAAVVSIKPGGGPTSVGAIAFLYSQAMPAPITIDVRVMLRRVDNAAAATPEGVGPIIALGEHFQAGVLQLSKSGALLQALGTDTLSLDVLAV